MNFRGTDERVGLSSEELEFIIMYILETHPWLVVVGITEKWITKLLCGIEICRCLDQKRRRRRRTIHLNLFKFAFAVWLCPKTQWMVPRLVSG